MKKVNTLILTGYGLSCENETAYALEQVGATTERVHINALIDGSVSLERFDLLVFTGGFSWGDDHGAGVVQAIHLQTRLGDRLPAFIARGGLIIGIGNGFQCLVNLGLLPGIGGDYSNRRVALTRNASGNFRCDWVHLAVDSRTCCRFTRGMEHFELPVCHGEGQFVTESDTLQTLAEQGQVVLRYATTEGRPAQGQFPCNPNGSLDDIAAICDPGGRVLGLMPHPELYNHWTNHPDWVHARIMAKRGAAALPGQLTPGLQIFKNAVDSV